MLSREFTDRKFMNRKFTVYIAAAYQMNSALSYVYLVEFASQISTS